MSSPRNRNLLVIIAVLLLTNMAVLGYFLWYKKPQKPEPPKDRNIVAEMLQKDVGFDEAQLVQYRQLREKQREKIRPMFDEMRKTKDSLFRLILQPGVNDSTVQRAADAIARKQRSLDLQTFAYFSNLRSLCKPDQFAKYDSVVVNIIGKLGKPMKRPDDEKKKQ